MDGNEAAVHMRYQGRVVALEQRQVGLERLDRGRVRRCGHGDNGWLGMGAPRNVPTVEEGPARSKTGAPGLAPWGTLCLGLQMSPYLVAVNCCHSVEIFFSRELASILNSGRWPVRFGRFGAVLLIFLGVPLDPS